MLGALHRFGLALRSGGLPISSDDIALAGTATLAIDVGDREQLRSALKATLLRRREDSALFDVLFDASFAGAGDAGGATWSELVRRLGREQAATVRAKLAAISPVADAILGAAPGDLDSVAAAAGARIDVGGAKSSLQSGAVAYRLAAEMRLEEIEAAALELSSGEFGDRDEVAADLVRRRVSDIRAQLRERVQQMITTSAPNRRRELSLSHLETRSLAGLSQKEARELSREVERLARALLAARRRKKRGRDRGHLDLSRTLRRSAATDGVPMTPRFVARPRRRPRLVVLCDVSDSVRNVSRFMLQLVYSIAQLTDGVRAFAFVAELGEITDVFRRHSIETALARVASGAVINVLANSNYGSAFDTFADRYLGALTARTTVLIIGDGRTNYSDPGLGSLAAIRRRAARVLWLNPEPASIWGFGDSAMNEYERLCDDVAVASNLASLRTVIDGLL